MLNYVFLLGQTNYTFRII